jgi:hypothetical protein
MTRTPAPPVPLTSAPERFQGIPLHGFVCASCARHPRPPLPIVAVGWYRFVGDVGRLELYVRCPSCERGLTLCGSPRVLE